MYAINNHISHQASAVTLSHFLHVLSCDFQRRNVMPTKTNVPQSMAAESQQSIEYLERISELLKHQRRHFDDAVVTHCIRLIQDYVEDNMREVSADLPVAAGSGRRS